MSAASPQELEARAKRVKLLLLDVDGVLTDGGMWFGPEGEAFKRFDVKDGHGIVMWRLAGGRTGILSARNSASTASRAKELRLDPVLQGKRDKRTGFAEALALTGLAAEEVAYMGDDTNDLAPLSLAGLALAPADATPEARAEAHLVMQAPGGRGAVREACELLLRAQGHWDDVIRRLREGI